MKILNNVFIKKILNWFIIVDQLTRYFFTVYFQFYKVLSW